MVACVIAADAPTGTEECRLASRIDRMRARALTHTYTHACARDILCSSIAGILSTYFQYWQAPAHIESAHDVASNLGTASTSDRPND